MSGAVAHRISIRALAGGTIKTRRGAVAAIIGLQAVVLMMGWFFTFMQVRHSTAEAVEDIVLSENVRIADWLAEQLALDVEGELMIGSPAWELVQSRVESLTLPGEGFACLLDNDGKILCHPDIRQNPGLRETTLGNMSLSPSDMDTEMMLSAAPRAETISGRLRFFIGGTHYIATRYVPELNARLVVHQPEAGLVSLSSSATLVVGLVASMAALVVLGSTALSTHWVMRRYDNVLERINKGLEGEVAWRTHENLAARDALILGLAKLADCRDNETGMHLERISEYSRTLAEQLAPRHEQIDEAWIERIGLASSMHDIGKVGLPDDILLKPGALTPAERLRMQTHTSIGADTLLAIRMRLGEDELLDMSIQIALEHHEKWDGTGYPLRVTGEQIALPARVVALADVYDALTSKRVYKAAMTHEQAREIIVDGRGTHFDPHIVDAFLEIEARFDAIRARLQPGEGAPLRRAA